MSNKPMQCPSKVLRDLANIDITDFTKSGTAGALEKKLLLKVSQYSQEDTCVKLSF